MKQLTYEELKKNLKSLGESEQQIVEAAETTSEIINTIIKARVASGLTQEQLAEKCGMKQSAIARMESLQSIPRLNTVIKVANCLKLKLCVESKYEQKTKTQSKYNFHNRNPWAISSSIMVGGFTQYDQN